MTVSSANTVRKPTETELIAYLARKHGLGWEDLRVRFPDIDTDVIKAVVFCKHDGPGEGRSTGPLAGATQD